MKHHQPDREAGTAQQVGLVRAYKEVVRLHDNAVADLKIDTDYAWPLTRHPGPAFSHFGLLYANHFYSSASHCRASVSHRPAPAPGNESARRAQL
jgi:hypothetical protein